MHPILKNRDALILYLVAWGALGLLMGASLAVPGKTTWGTALLFSLPMTLLYGFICLSAWYVCRSFPLQSTPTARLIMSVFLAAAFSSALWVIVGLGWHTVISDFIPSGNNPSWYSDSVPWIAGTGVVLFLLATAVNYLIDAFEASRTAERNTLELRVLARDAELKALRAQLDPHFLFNSLNAISALIKTKPDDAREMTVRLADFLRLSMKYGALEFVTLAKELDIGRKFLEIEKVRFGGRLNDEITVHPLAEHCLIPPLVLQPLIENAINHGIARILEGGTICMGAKCEGSSLVVTIENPVDRQSSSEKQPGIGIDNVRQRLLRLYGSDARLDIIQNSSRFRATLHLPLKY
jgi:two-component system sensor histidine kinase AlgZ